MDEISQGPERDSGLPRRPRRWLTAAAIASLIAVTAVLVVARGSGDHRSAASRTPAAATTHGPRAEPAPVLPPADAAGARMVVPEDQLPTAAPGPQPKAVPGTLLLTCDAALWGQLRPDWRAGSLRVGPLWLVAGRQLGYVHLGRTGPAGRAQPVHAAAGRTVEMLVHVDAGATVVMRAAAGASLHFQFAGADLGTGELSRAGDRGFTLVPCPRSAGSSGSWTDFYDLGFSITPGHTASVEVLTSASARPLWVTLSAPR